jgi:hypothetical protein
VPRSSCARCLCQLHVYIWLLTQRGSEAHLQAVVSLSITREYACFGGVFRQLRQARATAQVVPVSEMVDTAPNPVAPPKQSEIFASRVQRTQGAKLCARVDPCHNPSCCFISKIALL